MSEEYKNTISKLTAYNSEGYKVYTSLLQVENKQTPRIVCKSNPYTISNIRMWVAVNAPKIELLSNEYNGSGDLLLWKLKDSDLPPFKRSWSNFVNSSRTHPQLARAEGNSKKILNRVIIDKV